MLSEIAVSDLSPVPPVLHGLHTLKDDIKTGARVWCICAVGRDYHVGAKDAEDTLGRWVERGLLDRREADRPEDRIFVPRHPSPLLGPRLKEAEEECKAEVERAYAILREAYPEYDPNDERLIQQGSEIHDTFLEAFRMLRLASLLPPTTDSSAFNHQGMVLIMEPCFRSRQTFVTYLRKPTLLRLHRGDESEIERLIQERLELLERKYAHGSLSPLEQARLDELSEQVRKRVPLVTGDDYRALEQIAIEGKSIDATLAEIRRLMAAKRRTS
jgi:hypothetical protein